MRVCPPAHRRSRQQEAALERRAAAAAATAATSVSGDQLALVPPPQGRRRRQLQCHLALAAQVRVLGLAIRARKEVIFGLCVRKSSAPFRCRSDCLFVLLLHSFRLQQ